MSAFWHVAVAVPVAVGAAASFGGAGLLQHQAAQQVPPSGPLRPGLLYNLIKVPKFRWGVVLGALGFGLQALALDFAPLAVVQPILVTGLLFYLAFAALSLRRTPDRVLVLGALLALGGLIGFILVSSPEQGGGEFSSGAALPLGLALVTVVALCLVAASRMSKEMRALPLATATAVCYGVTAGLMRSLLSTPDIPTLFTQWQLYAVIVVGPAGFLLNQNAFQEGKVGAVAVATINVGDPVVAIGVGAAWLGESLTAAPAQTAGQVLLLMLMAGGVLLLAHRAQQVVERIRDQGGDNFTEVTW